LSSNENVYEVEFRCHFEDAAEAYRALPFLKASLTRRVKWITTFYGLDLFRSGRLLRVAEVTSDKKTRYYLGWKGPDIGHFANIRREIEEDITSGIDDSAILDLLKGNRSLVNKEQVVLELERLGHHRFMSFEGINMTGRYQPLELSLKLMPCAVLKWPLMVEIEKTSGSEAEAVECEKSLYDLCCQLQLQDRVVREEPPTLLFHARRPLA
jgi:adenylate cyclase class IV